MSTNNNSGDTKTSDKKGSIDKNATINGESTVLSDATNLFNTVFSTANIILIVWFLAAYLITYVVIGIFKSTDSGTSFVLRIIDAFIIISIFVYLALYYYNIPADTRTDSITNIGGNAYKVLNDTYTLLYSGAFLFLYYIVVFVLHIPKYGPGSPISLMILSTIAWVLFSITAIVVFCKEILGFSILDSEPLRFLWKTNLQKSEKKDDTGTTKVDDTKTESKAIVETNEVFNVSNNLYTYDDAKSVCASYDSRLATYNEIEDAYNKGAEWCNYGWSDGQMAFFPTQKSTWAELQKSPKTQNNCGRPGVNGGYMENPYIRFGVNCFGKKPKPSERDLQSMNANKNIIFPQTEEDALMDKKVKFWKENADKLLSLNGFNRTKWSGTS